MADVPPNVRRLIAQIVAHEAAFIFTPGTPLSREAFSATVLSKMDEFRRRDPSIRATDHNALRVFLNSQFGSITTPVDSAKFLEYLKQAKDGTVPDDLVAFLGAPPAADNRTIIGKIWDGAESGVRTVGTTIWENETLRAIAGVVAGTGVGYLSYHLFDALARSMGPDVPYLTSLFAFPVAITGAIMAFTMVRQQFPSNAVAEERARNRAAAPTLERTTSLEPALGLERTTELRPVTTSRLAGVGFKPAAGIHHVEGAEGVVDPVIRGEGGVILRG